MEKEYFELEDPDPDSEIGLDPDLLRSDCMDPDPSYDVSSTKLTKFS